MKNLKGYILLILLFICLKANCQDKIDLLTRDSSDSNTKELFQKYLSNNDSADDKINQLLIIANEDDRKNNYNDEIRKLQIALELEKYAQSDSTIFKLNISMGFVLSPISPQYALGFFNKALQVSLKSTTIKDGDKFQLYGMLAGIHERLNQNDSVLICYKMAETLAKSLVKPMVAQASTENNIGTHYANIGIKDSALIYFNKALNLIGIMENDSVLYCSINDNIAQQSELNGDYASAIKTYRYNDFIYLKTHRTNRYVINKVRLLEALYITNSGEMEQQIDSLDNFIDSNRVGVRLSETEKFYKFATTYFINKNRTAQAIRYFNKFLNGKKTIENQNAESFNALTGALLNLQNNDFKNQLKIYNLELDAAKQSLIHNRLIAIISILTGTFIIALLIIAMRNRRKKHEAEKIVAEAELKTKEAIIKTTEAELKTNQAELKTKQAEVKIKDAELKTQELEKKAAQQELELKKKDITNLVLHNTQVHDANKLIIDRLQEITRAGEDMEKSVKSFLVDLKNTNQMGDRALTIQNNIESVNAEFYNKLNKRFPDLSKSEAELCGYIRINLSTKEISVLKNVEMDSVKISKKRLRKKIGLSPDDDLYLFIENI